MKSIRARFFAFLVSGLQKVGKKKKQFIFRIHEQKIHIFHRGKCGNK